VPSPFSLQQRKRHITLRDSPPNGFFSFRMLARSAPLTGLPQLRSLGFRCRPSPVIPLLNKLRFFLYDTPTPSAPVKFLTIFWDPLVQQRFYSPGRFFAVNTFPFFPPLDRMRCFPPPPLQPPLLLKPFPFFFPPFWNSPSLYPPLTLLSAT